MEKQKEAAGVESVTDYVEEREGDATKAQEYIQKLSTVDDADAIKNISIN